jgi:hypothetical protein
MVVTYFPDGARYQRPFPNAAQAQHAANYLGGRGAGELADDDESNPVVYAHPPRL